MGDRGNSSNKRYEVLIVGAGPGGIQLATKLQSLGIDYLLIERENCAGSFFSRFPVDRKLLSINKLNTGEDDPEKNLRWDWNSLLSERSHLAYSNYSSDFFPSADSFVTYLNDFVAEQKLHISYNINIVSVCRDEGGFSLFDEKGKQYFCRLLVIATGLSLANVPDIPGAEFCENYTNYNRDPSLARGKDVLIIGKGNSAFETAEYLLPHAVHIHLISPKSLRLAMHTHYVGDVRSVNGTFLDTFFLKQQSAILNGNIARVQKEGDKLIARISFSENQAELSLKYDRIVVCTGFRFDRDMFSDDCKPSLDHEDRLPALNCRWESANIRNMFFCGALMQSSDYKRSSSAFIHGIRYNATVLGGLLHERLGRSAPATETLKCTTECVFAKLFERIHQSSSLWHLHDSLCDVYVLSSGARLELLRDVPINIMRADHWAAPSTRIEFSFTFSAPSDPTERAKFSLPSPLIHPRVRFFRNGSMISEFHMYEDIYADWKDTTGPFGTPLKIALGKFLLEDKLVTQG